MQSVYNTYMYWKNYLNIPPQDCFGLSLDWLYVGLILMGEDWSKLLMKTPRDCIPKILWNATTKSELGKSTDEESEMRSSFLRNCVCVWPKEMERGEMGPS